jgi:hypothetical protein
MSEPAQTDPPQPDADKPPWGDDFDAERAWSLVKNLRDDNAKLKSRPALTDEQQQKLTDWDRQEQASKTELERAREELTRWQTEASTWRTQAVSSRVERLAADDVRRPLRRPRRDPRPRPSTSAPGARSTRPPSRPTSMRSSSANRTGAAPPRRAAPSTRVPAPNFAHRRSAGERQDGRRSGDELAAILRSQLGT